MESNFQIEQNIRRKLNLSPETTSFPSVHKSKLNSPRYTISKPSPVSVLNQGLVPPWLQDIELKPIGYHGYGINLADFWSIKQRHIAKKGICPNKVRSRVGKVFHEAEEIEKQKFLEKKFSKNIALIRKNSTLNKRIEKINGNDRNKFLIKTYDNRTDRLKYDSRSTPNLLKFDTPKA